MRGRGHVNTGVVVLVAWIGLLAAPAFGQAFAQSGSDSETTPLGAPVARESAPVPAAGEGGGASPISLRDSLQTVLALGFVLTLAVVGAAVVKGLSKGRGGLLGSLGPGGPSPGGVLEILGRYPVAQGQTLILLRMDRRVLLLHQTTGRRGASMRTLSEVCDTDEVASILLKTRAEEDERVASGFREAMSRLERDFSAFDEDADPAGEGRREIVAASPEGDVVTLRSRLKHWTQGATA